MTAAALALFFSSTALSQSVLLTVPLSLDGRPATMDLLSTDGTALAAARRTAVKYGLEEGGAVEQLEEVMKLAVKEENEKRATPVQVEEDVPAFEYTVVGDDGGEYK